MFNKLHQPLADADWVQALQRGDEEAFIALVEQHHSSMIRVALIYVGVEIAEEVVQETWVAMLQGLNRFEGRSSLKTWLFSILLNKAKTIAKREIRHQHMSLIDDETATGTSVPPERFHSKDHPSSAGHWAIRPQSWEGIPEEHLLLQETLDIVKQSIMELPLNQREVLILRDIEEWSSAEVCNVLEISDTNQRVILHRARSKVRAVLERYLQEDK